MTARRPASRNKKRTALLETRLSSGRTMQELFESWGFSFDAEGWLAGPSSSPQPAETARAHA